MGCSYYENKAMFGLDVYCHKKGDYVNHDMFDRYCKGYSYDECPIYKGSSGSSSGGCFLTSACVEAMGLPDDCYELETLRHFRDTWLKEQEGGACLIHRYYGIAPAIVDKINTLEDRKEIYTMIYERMVKPCVELIEKGEYQEATALYQKITEELAAKYLG